ncbi:uncharacterized protein EV420DRAFT_1508518 [Desarmillaria tabescens]|uniref:Uncharacterized protein n=1 Tax=Armillaria tabescens TaxID=1929756 RepID=A0AA39NHT7_ARMTA|nr:uncharacterized protein EV420DRAFT_1508518 [Desarmillaria tabescens]KAK0465894.1 hypothetical protein EV420DRAFT_1508518 [Desarmillaria tabescens]
MSFSPRKTRSATGALHNRTAAAPVARPAKKGRVVSSSKAKSNISPVQRLHDLLTDALNTAKSLEMTPDNHVALQNVRKIAVSLLDILPGEKRAVKDLKYELHDISLTSLSSELATSEKYDPEDRHDEQGPLMDRIMKEVVEWLPDIWLTMAEENADMDLIRRCLILCSSAADDLGGEYDCTDTLVITNSEKKTVYNQSHYVVDYMAWMWREFLVFSAVRGAPVSVCGVIRDDEEYEQIFSLFRQDTTGTFLASRMSPLRLTDDGIDPKNEDGYAFWDDHWSEEMRTIANRLYAERHNHRITEFIKKPSFHLYTKLVSDYPDIKSSLLCSVRERLFLDKPFIRYFDAAEILAAASQTEDIVRLPDYLTDKNFTLHAPTVLIIVKYLSNVSDKKLRTRALQVVEKGLKTLKRDTLDAVNHLFPGLGDAQLWLCCLRDAGDFPFDDDTLHDKYNERDANLRSFAERAANGGPLTDPNWAPPVKKPEIQREFDVEDEDDYLEEVPQLSERDLEQSIQDWAQALSEWPDQKAAAEMWNRIKFDSSELLLSVVEGAEEALMDRIQKADSVQIEKWRQANPPPPPPPPRPKSQPRPHFWRMPASSYRSYYDYDRSPSRVYSYVMDGLHALIKTFACQDHRNLCR